MVNLLGALDGGGNVYLPLKRGGTVDIDWLNTIISLGGVTPNSAMKVYLLGKPTWAIAHGIAKFSWKTFMNHMKTFGTKEESEAAQLAGELLLKNWKFSEIFDFKLVQESEKTLKQFRK